MGAEVTALVEIVDDLEVNELDMLTDRLRAELLEIDVEGVETVAAGPGPSGSRGPSEMAQVGALLITVASPEVVTAVLGLLRSWLPGSRARALRVTVDGDELVLDDATADQQQAVVDAWLRRHGAA